ncbi:MAG: hypothetical protein RLO81_15260 [Fulvivirga sp.]|uniref:hypothetical protein n=1 Tax=Fulvivirga sp. TaxID=1931237 RepID=UPI0032EFE759
MNYEELESLWNSTEKLSTSQIELNKQLIRETLVKKVRSKLSEMKWESIFWLIIGYFWIEYLVAIMIDFWGQNQFFIPATILALITLFSIVLISQKLYHFYSMKSENSILENQRHIRKLKQLELIDVKSLIIIIPLFAVCFLIVMAKYVLDFNLYQFTENLVYHTISSFFVGMIITFFLLKHTRKSLEETIEELNRFV